MMIAIAGLLNSNQSFRLSSSTCLGNWRCTTLAPQLHLTPDDIAQENIMQLVLGDSRIASHCPFLVRAYHNQRRNLSLRHTVTMQTSLLNAVEKLRAFPELPASEVTTKQSSCTNCRLSTLQSLLSMLSTKSPSGPQ